LIVCSSRGFIVVSPIERKILVALESGSTDASLSGKPEFLVRGGRCIRAHLGQSRSKRQLIGIGYCFDLQRYSDYHDSLIASSSRFLFPHDKLLNFIGRDASRFPKGLSLGSFERVIADGYRLGSTNKIPISLIKYRGGSLGKIKPKMAAKTRKRPGTSVGSKME